MTELIDKGSARDTRLHACTKRTWCIEVEGHFGECTEKPRTEHQPPKFGPAAKR